MNNFDSLYQRVNRVCPVSREEFDGLLTYTAGRLCALCGRKYVYINAENAEGGIYDEYESALASGILFCLRDDPNDAAAFYERARYAFRIVWCAKADEARKREAAV